MENEYHKWIDYYILKDCNNALFDDEDEYGNDFEANNVFNQEFRTLEEAFDAIIPLFKENLTRIIERAARHVLYIPCSVKGAKTEYIAYDKDLNRIKANEKRLDLSRLNMAVGDVVDGLGNKTIRILITCPTQQRYYGKVRDDKKVEINGEVYKKVGFKEEETEWDTYYNVNPKFDIRYSGPQEQKAEPEILKYEFRIEKRCYAIWYYKPGDKLTI